MVCTLQILQLTSFSEDLFKACAFYYYVWIVLIPKLGGYEIVEEVEELEGGAKLARLVRKYHSNTSLSENGSPERAPLLR